MLSTLSLHPFKLTKDKAIFFTENGSRELDTQIRTAAEEELLRRSQRDEIRSRSTNGQVIRLQLL